MKMFLNLMFSRCIWCCWQKWIRKNTSISNTDNKFTNTPLCALMLRLNPSQNTRVCLWIHKNKTRLETTYAARIKAKHLCEVFVCDCARVWLRVCGSMLAGWYRFSVSHPPLLTSCALPPVISCHVFCQESRLHADQSIRARWHHTPQHISFKWPFGGAFEIKKKHITVKFIQRWAGHDLQFEIQ